MRAANALVAVLFAAGVVTHAQNRPIPEDRTFRAGINLTSVTATVRDEEGRLVTSLGRGDFEIFEDGEPMTIAQFTSERVPLSLGLLLDTSDSMHGKRLEDARAAVSRLLLELLDHDDEFFLVAFNHAHSVLTGWTTEPATVRLALDNLIPTGSTAAYDAVMASLPFFARRGRQRAALLIISDGADTASDTSIRSLRSALNRADVFVYAIAIDPPDTPALNVRVNPQALRAITDPSGGRTEVIQNSADLAETTARIAEELNNQYVLGYSPRHGDDGLYHRIRVSVRGVNYHVRSRNGYVAAPPAR
jgi:Ca-activated chloride channel family protein